MKKGICIALVVGSFLLGILAIALVKRDPNFTNVWLPFWLHIASILFACSAFLVHRYSKKSFFSALQEKEVLAFGAVLLCILFLNFFQLTTFPLVSVGDEVRDSGLYAQQIASGQIKNIFGYGAYDGYGLIIPVITSLFYKVFLGSVLTYRVPAAIVGVLDVLILYILLRQITGRFISVLGAGILAVMPMHLFFARTQPVVAFNSFWTSSILLATYVLFENNSVVSYIFLGILLGFASEFHATARVIAILVFLLTVCFKAIAVLRKKIHFFPTIMGFVLLIVFSVIAFGPQILFSNTENFFHTGRFVLQKNLTDQQAPSLDQLATIGHGYILSLGAWVVSPVGGDFFHDDQPLVPMLLVPLFLLGLGYGVFFVRKPFVYILSGLIVLIPFFSSAITDAVNADQRLNSALPIAVLFCSIGIYSALRLLRWKYLQWVLLSGVGLYIFLLGVNFFVRQTPNIGREVHDYMSMHIIYAIQEQIGKSTDHQAYCAVVSKNMLTNLDYMHYQEQYQYFLPTITLDKKADSSLQDSQVYLYKGVCSSQEQPMHVEVIPCNGSLNYFCPLQFKGELQLYYN